jgi:acyl carrier protein
MSADLIDELKALVLEAAEKAPPEGGLQDDEVLFGPDSRLGLDSLDALQISMAIQERFGVRMTDSKDTRRALTSIAHLALHLSAPPDGVAAAVPRGE